MATDIRVKIIEKDNIQALEKAINDFFTSISNKQTYDVGIDAKPLLNGNKIYVATINYDSVLASVSAPLVKLFETDEVAVLQNTMNAYISPGSGPTLIRSSEIILKQGNKSYVAIVGYNIGNTNNSVPAVTASGTYTPTVIGFNSNVSSATPSVAQWSRVGNVVTVSGLISIVKVANDLVSTVDISTPVASAFSGGTINCGGTFVDRGSNQNGDCGSIVAVPTSTVRLRYTPTSTSSNGFSYHYTYLIN